MAKRTNSSMTILEYKVNWKARGTKYSRISFFFFFKVILTQKCSGPVMEDSHSFLGVCEMKMCFSFHLTEWNYCCLSHKHTFHLLLIGRSLEYSSSSHDIWTQSATCAQELGTTSAVKHWCFPVKYDAGLLFQCWGCVRAWTLCPNIQNITVNLH